MLQVIFVGYFGGKSHQPRVIGSSALAMGVGCLIMSLSYFTSPTYAPQTGEFSLICHPGGSESKIIHQISTEPNSFTTDMVSADFIINFGISLPCFWNDMVCVLQGNTDWLA